MTTTPTVGRPPTGASLWGKRKASIPGMSTFHRGVDIAAPTGTPVVAPEAGTVTRSTYNLIRGHYVDVDHGRFTTRHQHLKARAVKAGQWVAESQNIGVVGSTGASTGPHLHTEVHDGSTPIDPTPWYAARGVTLGVPTPAPRPAPVPKPTPDPFGEDDTMHERAIIAAYRLYLGRTPGDAEVDDRILRIATGQATLAQEIASVKGSPEAKRWPVTRLYQRMLGRPASPAEADHWVAVTGGDVAKIEAAIRASDEYKSKH